MNGDDFVNGLRDLVNTLDETENAAFDLWTHLPSYQEACKHHGDYASEFHPSVHDVLTEAAYFISHKTQPTEEQIKEAGEFYRCPCGEH